MGKRAKAAPPADAPFVRHMARYAGSVVTVYAAGCTQGVTGLLAECTGCYIRLLVQACPPPEPPNRCGACLRCPLCPARQPVKPAPAESVVVDIPTERVVYFAHRA